MGEFLFISLFLWWVVLFMMRTIREGRGEGEEGEQLHGTLLLMPCQPSCCFQIEVGLTSGKKYFAFKLDYLHTMKGF